VVDSGLRFESSRCAFTAADDAAIRSGEITAFSEKGVFVKKPVDSWLLSVGPYRENELREKSVRLPLRLRQDDECFYFERRERVKSSRGYLVDKWMRCAVKEHERRPNAWLDLSFSEMSELCHELDVEADDALSAELPRYDQRDEYEYDRGFGFIRVRS
jgi:CRISPR-associated endonuclease/helicase Cas3